MAAPARRPEVNFKRLELGRKAQRVARFHTDPTTEHQTVGAHTFGICLILLEITEGNCSPALMKAALYHDVAEALTGDTPSPLLSRFPDLKAAHVIAEKSIEMLYDLSVDLTPEERRQLKLADGLELMLFALEDLQRGNLRAGGILSRVVAGIRHNNLLVHKNECALFDYVMRRYTDADTGGVP
jgi:5'-deoxynucleotidase YfbR-like HD superfamily hydrolase